MYSGWLTEFVPSLATLILVLMWLCNLILCANLRENSAESEQFSARLVCKNASGKGLRS